MTVPTRIPPAIATTLAVLAVAAPAAAATGEPKNAAPSVAAAIRHPTPIDRIIAQEDARREDPAIFGTREPKPSVVRIVERPEGFDWGDAGIGGAATLALVLIVAGGAALRHESRRQEAHG